MHASTVLALFVAVAAAQDVITILDRNVVGQTYYSVGSDLTAETFIAIGDAGTRKIVQGSTTWEHTDIISGTTIFGTYGLCLVCPFIFIFRSLVPKEYVHMHWTLTATR
jgi:hypothetical protein